MTRGRFELEHVSGAPVSDAELLADVRRVAGESGGATVGHKLYRERGRFDDRTVARRFGSWNGALRAAGLDVANEVSLSDEVLFANLLALWTHHGRQPRRADLALEPSRVSQSPYMRRFGSWGAALVAFVDYANGADAPAPRALDGSPARRTGRDPSLRLRFRVLQRDRFACRACGASPATTSGVVLHVDHVQPWSAGGETTLENLQTLCDRCNLGKSNSPS